ncbi:MAG: sigma-70 family RNA polymerase sigma factor [Pseudomonadales bacterium]|nr:sigma-70 family RNA polymerase sigma factor [Pseudomonadales bacterium]MBO7007949.1 sigma-70 family RNA polymerase sigma factor [Pseudomonadales bacterium]
MVRHQDEQALKQYAAGDTRAFDQLYGKYRDLLYGYLVKSCSDRELADEMFQDVWLRVIKNASRYESRGKFRQWLFSVAHNVVVDHHRRNKHKFEEITELASDSSFESQEIGSRISQAIKTLPFEQRQAFHLREQLGCSIRGISEIQACTEEAAKSRIRYAYSRLRQQLKDLL